MDKEPQAKDEMIEGVRGLIDQNLNKVEAQVDSTVDTAKGSVHEMRNEAEKAADRALNRFKGTWERTQQKLEEQMALHPWVLLGSLLFVGYLLSYSRRSQGTGGRSQAREPKARVRGGGFRRNGVKEGGPF